ncbi:MAG TPA: hypothetical protein PLK57_06425 [Clostridiales bacterium]|nr:hypothetical protein [Clostridiales bacterium]HXK82986.1 hypothetical protein [Clostridiales bacterium]
MEQIMEYIMRFFEILREFLQLIGVELPDCPFFGTTEAPAEED